MFGLSTLKGICLWAWVSWTQRLLGKLIQDQSWPLIRLWDLDWEKRLQNNGAQRPVYKKTYMHPVFTALNPFHYFLLCRRLGGTRGWVWTGVKNFAPHRGSNPEPSSP